MNEQLKGEKNEIGFWHPSKSGLQISDRRVYNERKIPLLLIIKNERHRTVEISIESMFNIKLFKINSFIMNTFFFQSPLN